MKKPWVIRHSGRDVHVVPARDLRRHKKGRHCWCGPRFQDENENPMWEGDKCPVVVVHKALDGRE